jgi:hypothetical protein
LIKLHSLFLSRSVYLSPISQMMFHSCSPYLSTPAHQISWLWCHYCMHQSQHPRRPNQAVSTSTPHWTPRNRREGNSECPLQLSCFCHTES